MDPENSAGDNPDTVHRMGGMEKTVGGILLAVTLLITLFFTIGEGLIHRKKQAPSPVPQAIAVCPVPMEPPALAALEAFFEAPDLASKAALVRDSARVLPMMDDYYQRREHPFPTLGRISKGKVADADGTALVFFEVEPFSGPRYPVAVVWDGRRFAVDWESLTAYGTIDWNEFIETKPSAGNTFRVYLQSASDAEQIPGAAQGSRTFLITHRDDSQSIVALAEANLAARLNPMVIRHRVPVTLELAWKPSGPGGVPVPEIVNLIAPKWSP